MTHDDLRKLQERLPLSRSTIARNSVDAQGLRAADEKPVEGSALECAAPRKKESSVSAVGSTQNRIPARITFRVFSRTPADWDNYHIKELQDLLCCAQILVGDDWNILSGEIISEKVHAQEDQRTEIVIVL